MTVMWVHGDVDRYCWTVSAFCFDSCFRDRSQVLVHDAVAYHQQGEEDEEESQVLGCEDQGRIGYQLESRQNSKTS